MTVTHVEKEYKFEMEQHKKVAKNTTTTPAVSTTPEEAEKDAASLKLYEDLTDLGILNVKVVQGKNGKEYTFNCIQTVGSRSTWDFQAVTDDRSKLQAAII